MADIEFSEDERRIVGHALALSMLEMPAYAVVSHIQTMCWRSPRIAAVILSDDVLRKARADAQRIAIEHPNAKTRKGFARTVADIDAVIADRLARVTTAVPIGADLCPKCRTRPGVIREGFGSETFTGICGECAK